MRALSPRWTNPVQLWLLRAIGLLNTRQCTPGKKISVLFCSPARRPHPCPQEKSNSCVPFASSTSNPNSMHPTFPYRWTQTLRDPYINFPLTSQANQYLPFYGHHKPHKNMQNQIRAKLRKRWNRNIVHRTAIHHTIQSIRGIDVYCISPLIPSCLLFCPYTLAWYWEIR